jgi:hypothetical protein
MMKKEKMEKSKEEKEEVVEDDEARRLLPEVSGAAVELPGVEEGKAAHVM